MFQEPMLPSEPTTETMPAADNAALVQNAPALLVWLKLQIMLRFFLFIFMLITKAFK
jgi:hypothetical protein